MRNISDLKLERYLLGELPAAELRAIETLLTTDPRLRDRLQALEESGAAILRETPPDVFAKRLRALERRRMAEAAVTNTARASGFRTSGVWKPLLGSLALLVVLAVPIGFFNHGALQNVSDAALAPSSPAAAGIEGAGQGLPTSSSLSSASPSPAASENTPEQNDTRLKGLEPHLAIFRKTDSGAEPLHPGEKARPGQFLRIGYQAGGYPYGAILSVDGNGNVTRHWPAEGDRAGRLENGEALLPSSFELDAAPDYERFYFVVSKKPFELNPLLRSLHANESLPDLGKIRAAKETRIVGFEILKENGI